MARVQQLYDWPPIVTTMDIEEDYFVHTFGLKTPRETGLSIRETVAVIMKSKRSIFIGDDIKDMNDIPAMTQQEEDELLARITPPSDQFIEADRGLFKIESIIDSDDESNNSDWELLDIGNSDAKYSITYATERVPVIEVVAISYGWHEKTNEKDEFEFGKGIKLTLGHEWDPSRFLLALADLSKQHWIWMDQLSIPQADVSSEMLTRIIPDVYRSVKVVVFLPYTPCAKLLSFINTVRESLGREDVSSAFTWLYLHAYADCRCLGGLKSWLRRLWAWQEFVLASSMRFVWGLGFRKRASWSVLENPASILANEMKQRNALSLIIGKRTSEAINYYYCVRLLCGAEVNMLGAVRVDSGACLQVLSHLRDTGRKATRAKDFYLAAAAFVKVSFLHFSKTSDADEDYLHSAYASLYAKATNTVYTGSTPSGLTGNSVGSCYGWKSLKSPVDINDKPTSGGVLSGMTEQAFCACSSDSVVYGEAYPAAIDEIRIGGFFDSAVMSIFRIIECMHPAQRKLVCRFNAIKTSLLLKHFPLVIALYCATIGKVREDALTALGAVTALYARCHSCDYIKAIRVLLGDEFDSSITDEQYDSLRLVKVKLHGQVWCLGITSKTKALRVVRSHRRLLLCMPTSQDWVAVGYIPGLDASHLDLDTPTNVGVRIA
ncbi:hypothetical protein V7S43_009972 [Phytophthora oleae]|uniref:Heterokaryon incompatibility domain-containing protein n=1 Tax=Phytophthora oleae TaxID=2107226 RepID=A0ABD3FFV6_9STRA